MSPKATSRVAELGEEVKLHLTVTTPAGPLDTNTTTLIFLHFWGGSANTFKAVVNDLSSFFATVAPSFRGWGASTGPDEAGAYSIAELSSDVETVIQTLGLKSVVLVGHSMGGKVAAAIAGRHTLPAGLLKGLVLLAPAPPSPMSLPTPSMREQQLRAFDNIENAEAAIRTLLTAPESPALTDEGMAEDIREFFDRIEIPVLVVAGEKDAIEPPNTMATEIRDRLNNRVRGQANLIIVEGSGHLLPIEKPTEVAQSTTSSPIIGS